MNRVRLTLIFGCCKVDFLLLYSAGGTYASNAGHYSFIPSRTRPIQCLTIL